MKRVCRHLRCVKGYQSRHSPKGWNQKAAHEEEAGLCINLPRNTGITRRQHTLTHCWPRRYHGQLVQGLPENIASAHFRADQRIECPASKPALNAIYEIGPTDMRSDEN